MDNIISTNLTLDSFLAHEGKGHLDGGQSGRYDWGSGVRPYQSLEPTINLIKNDPVPSETKEYPKAVKFISPKLFAATASTEQLKAAIAEQQAKSDKIKLRTEFLKNQKRLSKGKPIADESKKKDKDLSALSDDELKAKSSRLQLEKNYLDLKKATGKVTLRKQFIDKFKKEATDNVASLTANAATNSFIKAVNKWTPLNLEKPKGTKNDKGGTSKKDAVDINGNKGWIEDGRLTLKDEKGNTIIDNVPLEDLKKQKEE